MKSNELAEHVLTSIRRGSDPELVDYHARLVVEIANKGTFPRDWFEGICAALENDEIRQHSEAWKLVHMLNENWEDMEAQQAQRSLRLIRDVFQNGPYSMTALVIAEMIAEREEPSAAVAWIEKEAQVQRGALLASAIHAIAGAWPRITSSNMKARLMDLARASTRDEDQEVRREATVTLETLASMAGEEGGGRSGPQ